MATSTEFSRPLKFINDLWIGRIPVDIDDSRTRMVWGAQCFVKEAFGGISVALCRKQKIDGVPSGIHRSI
jgi:hypothetical protein